VALLASEGDCKVAMFYTPVEVKFATVRTSLCARHDPVSTLLQIDISYTRIQPVSSTVGETRPTNTILCVGGKNYDSQTANLGFDASCSIQSYRLRKVSQNQNGVGIIRCTLPVELISSCTKLTILVSYF